MNDARGAAILAVIIGMGLINFGLRFVPLALLSRMELPRPVRRWLSFVPIAVMGALVASEVVHPGGETPPLLTSPYVWASLLTMLVFRFTRSFLGATLAGVIGFVAFRAMLGS